MICQPHIWPRLEHRKMFTPSLGKKARSFWIWWQQHGSKKFKNRPCLKLGNTPLCKHLGTSKWGHRLLDLWERNVDPLLSDIKYLVAQQSSIFFISFFIYSWQKGWTAGRALLQWQTCSIHFFYCLAKIQKAFPEKDLLILCCSNTCAYLSAWMVPL